MRDTTALHTDQYEMTALRAALGSGVAHHPASFEVFARSLPAGRRYGVFCGVARLTEAIAAFRFDRREVDFLVQRGVADDALASYLEGFAFCGDVHAYAEGELYFPYSPVLRVASTFAEGILLETLVLSILNHDTAIASAASRMASVANGRPLIEMGSRRTHEEAAVAVARAAYIGGFGATSNLAAGLRYGVPTVGTAMHAFTLAHPSELEAFRAQIASLGVGTTLLIDTYDIAQGARHAVAAANEVGAAGPGAVRIDSGDLHAESARVRSLLDSLGATATRITVTSDLDEYAIDSLATSPVDSYGVGTRLVSGSGAPTAGFVYKLVAIGGADGAMHPVAKRSVAKGSVGGTKTPYRLLDGPRAAGECFSLDGTVPPGARPLQRTVLLAGNLTAAFPLGVLSDQRVRALEELPEGARSIQAGPPAFVAGCDATVAAGATGAGAVEYVRTAVVVVDVQGTFADDVEGAGLPVPGAGRTVDPIRRFVLDAAGHPSVVAVVTSQDWHPPQLPGHIAGPGEAPDFALGLFPRHGVAGTAEAELHPRFATPALLSSVTGRVYKGQHSAAFSAFEGTDATDGDGTPLAELLRARRITRVVVLGWEFANCVSATVRSALDAGFETVVIPELCSVLDPASLDAGIAALEAAGALPVTASELLDRLGAEEDGARQAAPDGGTPTATAGQALVGA